MATHRMSILGAATVPDTTGSVWQEPYPILATNDVWKHLVFILADTATRIGIYGQFQVPKNYVGTPKVVFIWTAIATSGDVEFDFDYRAVGGDDTESLDQAGTQETVNANDTAPSAVNERMECSIALTAGNFAVDDTVEFFAVRDGTDGGDTMAASCILFDVMFEYTDV